MNRAHSVASAVSEGGRGLPALVVQGGRVHPAPLVALVARDSGKVIKAIRGAVRPVVRGRVDGQARLALSLQVAPSLIR